MTSTPHLALLENALARQKEAARVLEIYHHAIVTRPTPPVSAQIGG